MFAGKGAAVLLMCAFMFHSTLSHRLSACMHVDGRQLSAGSCADGSAPDSSMLPWRQLASQCHWVMGDSCVLKAVAATSAVLCMSFVS
jgi:hypothetical protein